MSWCSSAWLRQRPELLPHHTIDELRVHADLSQWLLQVHDNVLPKRLSRLYIALALIAQVTRVQGGTPQTSCTLPNW
eukprot:COSAG03_NODE_20612_length_316_cov_1.184332_1_plen_76_part_01